MKEQFLITGMHCVNCARAIEKSVGKLNGVKKVNVNFPAKKATVDGEFTDQEVIKTIEKTGYQAEVYDPSKDLQADQNESRKWFHKFLIGLGASIPMIYFMVGEFGVDLPLMEYMPIVSAIIATLVQVFLGWDFYKGMIAGFRNKSFNMDSLIAIGTTTAYLYSLISYIIYIVENGTVLEEGSTGEALMSEKVPNMYFETSVFLITFVVLGKWLEATATASTNSAVQKLIKLQPKTAHVKRGNKWVDLEVQEVKVGDVLMVKPGEQIPVDGVVLSGTTAINESMVTGESIPVDKKKGDSVIGATINGDGSIEIEAQKVGADTVLAQIIKLVEDAQGKKAPIENLADKIASVFVPTVLIIALLTFLIWYFVIGSEFSFALMSFVSVVVISCPCALGLATPTAVTVGIGQGSKSGILIKGGDVLQKMSKISAVCFDKTGTITQGKPEVKEVVVFSNSNFGGDKEGKEKVLQISGSLEQVSGHSLATAILDEVKKNKKIKLENVSNFTAVAGLGIEGTINKSNYYLGNLKFVERILSQKVQSSKNFKENVSQIESYQNKGETVAILFDNKEILGLITIFDEPRVEAKEAVQMLDKMKIESYLISGDNKNSVDAVAKEVGIKNTLAEVLPEQKSDEIKKLQSNGQDSKNKDTKEIDVAMVGDGINDAPALAQANVGFAIGSGTDIAIETGDVVLVKNDPEDVAIGIQLAKSTVRKIYQNLFFSLIYNSCGIPIAAGCLAGIGIVLQPQFAGLAMALSSVSVVTNSLLLKFFKPQK